jgi:hypothetical protein
MALNDQKNAEIFSAAVKGIPRVVDLITTFPAAKRPAALAAAQQSYLQTARTLGYSETETQQWASMIISMLENAMWRTLIPRNQKISNR